MASLLTEGLNPDDLKKFEIVYYDLKGKNEITPQATLNYASHLTQSLNRKEIRTGIKLLKDLYKTTTNNPEVRKQCIYYLIIANTKLEKYRSALKYIKLYEKYDPGNRRIKEIKGIVKSILASQWSDFTVIGSMVLLVMAVLGVLNNFFNNPSE